MGGRSRKKFKLPNVDLKAPKVPGFIRALSKERKKNKDKDGNEENEDGAKAEDGEDKKEGEDGDVDKTGEDGEEAPKDAKTKVKEAIENIQIPKMPKIHKPAFLKKKKDGEEGEEAIENDEDKKGDGDEDKENPDEKKDGDAEEGDKDKKTKTNQPKVQMKK